MLFQMHWHFLCWWNYFQLQCKTDPHKLYALTNIHYPSKKELQSFLSIINYLRKLPLATAKVCEPLPKLMSLTTECKCKKSYHEQYERATVLIKRYMHKSLWCSKAPLPRQMHLGLALEQEYCRCEMEWTAFKMKTPDDAMLRPKVFANKTLSSAKRWQSNTDSTEYPTWAGKIPKLLFYKRSEHHHYRHA